MKTTSIPYCYYPTTLVLIDDDENFLDSLQISLAGPNQGFSNPKTALKFLLSSATFSSLNKSCLTDESSSDQDTSTFSVDITSVYEEIYDPTRFNEISVIVVDYQMPGMNGIEFCKAARKALPKNNFKIIMLTGEASHELAINAFNDSIIDHFIQKGTLDLYNTLTTAIADLKFENFQDVSGYVANSFINSNHALSSFLYTEIFATFFKDILKKYRISEYYILSNLGDFLMITHDGKLCYFMVRDDQTFHDLIRFEVEQEYWSEPSPEATLLFESIQRKEKIPFLWGLKDLPEFMDWPLYPVESQPAGKGSLYYAFIQDDPLDRGINLSKVQPFKEL